MCACNVMTGGQVVGMGEDIEIAIDVAKRLQREHPKSRYEVVRASDGKELWARPKQTAGERRAFVFQTLGAV